MSETGSAEASYYTWVDQFDTFGLGANVPWATGNANESLMALVDGQWLNFVVPYPHGFYAKWMDGRIDDPNARLERHGRVGDLRHAHAVPHRNRQGHQAEGGEIPAPARSAGKVRRMSVGRTTTRASGDWLSHGHERRCPPFSRHRGGNGARSRAQD